MFNIQLKNNRGPVMAVDTSMEGWSRALDRRDQETGAHGIREIVAGAARPPC